MNEASSAIKDLRNICEEVKESIDPIILSSIEALIDKTYTALQDDSEESRSFFEETLFRGVDLVEESKNIETMDKVAINKIVEQNIEDLLLKVGDIIDEHEGVEHSNIERRIVVTPDKTDHAYSKRISSLPYPTLRTSKTESHEGPTSSSAKSLERLEETSKVISHNKAKKVLKSVGLNPFIPRYTNAPSSTAITKHVFNKPAGNIKTNVTSKSVMIDLVKTKPPEIKIETKTKLDVVDVGTNTEKSEPVRKSKRLDPPNTIMTKHTQHWTVANFNKKMKMANGKSIDSMFFSISLLGKKSDWSLMLYPNGDKEKSLGFLSLYLTCRNRRGLDTAMDFKFTVLDDEGKAASTPSKSGSISANMLSTNSSWGWESFVKQQDLKRSGLIVNNKLTICCDITLKITDPDKLKKSPQKEAHVVQDNRDIDALVDFVGEISLEESPKKKKGKRNKSIKGEIDKLEEEEEVNVEEDINVERESKSENPEKFDEEKPVEICLQDLGPGDFQVVTRRRRKNSQSNTSSSPTPVEGNTAHKQTLANSRPAQASSPVKEVKKKDPRKDPVNISSLCLDTKESLAELLQTKTLLEENMTRLTELAVIKSGCIKQMTEDKDTKLEVLAKHNEQLQTLKTELELKLKEQKKVLEGLELEVEDVDIQIKRGKEKGARMKMYLDMNIADASSELKRLGEEKEELRSRLDSVEYKLRGNQQKDRLLNIHNQILRLQTNLECPICTETARSPIYQCKEGHLVCSSCAARVARCAICREAGPVNVRNRYAENDSQELTSLLLERDQIMSNLTAGAK